MAIDTTFHISDLLVVATAVCTVIGFVGRQIIRAVKHRLYTIDMTLKDHGTRIVTLEQARQEHETMLKSLGFRSGTLGIALRRDVDGV